MVRGGRAAYYIDVNAQEPGGCYPVSFFNMLAAREDARKVLPPFVPFKAAQGASPRLFPTHLKYRVMRSVHGEVRLQRWTGAYWSSIFVLGATARTAAERCTLKFLQADEEKKRKQNVRLHAHQATEQPPPSEPEPEEMSEAAKWEQEALSRAAQQHVDQVAVWIHPLREKSRKARQNHVERAARHVALATQIYKRSIASKVAELKQQEAERHEATTSNLTAESAAYTGGAFRLSHEDRFFFDRAVDRRRPCPGGDGFLERIHPPLTCLIKGQWAIGNDMLVEKRRFALEQENRRWMNNRQVLEVQEQAVLSAYAARPTLFWGSEGAALETHRRVRALVRPIEHAVQQEDARHIRRCNEIEAEFKADQAQLRAQEGQRHRNAASWRAHGDDVVSDEITQLDLHERWERWFEKDMNSQVDPGLRDEAQMRQKRQRRGPVAVLESPNAAWLEKQRLYTFKTIFAAPPPRINAPSANEVQVEAHLPPGVEAHQALNPPHTKQPFFYYYNTNTGELDSNGTKAREPSSFMDRTGKLSYIY